ncbi:MAG: tRNA (N(6)-L-threonylcarbamoyladenosine(37)-C(2))-methylthiotransferase [Candidatus Micrarchaeota archaeon]
MKTYGCTLNQADGELLAALVKRSGYSITDSEEKARVLIVNTCGVKPATEEKIVAYLQKLSETKTKPAKKIIVCGCLPAMNLARVAAAAPDAFVFGAASPEKVVAALGKSKPKTDLRGSEARAIACRRKTLALLKRGFVARIPIAYGCRGACAFCGTRASRGPLVSVPLSAIVREVKQAAADGALEVRLTAQDAGCWGFDLKPRRTLVDLLRAINALPGNFLCRVGMMNPEHAAALLPKIAEQFAGSRVFRFVHLPLQSGSDAVLKAMNRPYTVKQFRKVVAEFRRALPGIMVATDVIVGFPTETESDFRATLKVMKEMNFVIVNVSKYGSRPTALAARLKALPNGVVKRRAIEAMALARRIAARRNSRFIGKTVRARFAEAGAKGGCLGRSEEYAPVIVRKGVRLGETRLVKIRAAGAAWLDGVV